jgi:hypothetical protein
MEPPVNGHIEVRGKRISLLLNESFSKEANSRLMLFLTEIPMPNLTDMCPHI